MPEQSESQLLEQTRREIGRIVGEVEVLADRDIPLHEFVAEFLQRVSSALAAQACAWWAVAPDGNTQLLFQIDMESVGLRANAAEKQAHDGLLRFMLNQGKPALIAPRSGYGDDTAPAGVRNPTDFLLVLAPVIVSEQAIALVEVFQDASRRSTAHQGYVQFLSRMASEAAKYFKNQHLRRTKNLQKLWDQVEAFVRSVHGGLHPKQVAFLIANDGRKLIECERLSVAVKRGRGRAVIEAISGQDVVEKRSNLVQRMARLADCVIKHGENLIYTGKIEAHWPKDIVQALERYLDESPCKLLAVVPMEDQREFGSRGKAAAALVAEMIEDRGMPEEIGGRIEVVARHASGAVYNALEHHRVFLLPVWRFVGNITNRLGARSVPKIAMVLAIIGGIVATMILLPWPLRLEGKGALVPEIRRTVFAQAKGVVRELKAEHAVETDVRSYLGRISSPDLERDLIKLQGDLLAASKALQALEADRNRPEKQDSDLGGKIATQKQAIDGYTAEIIIVQRQIADLEILSPIRGKVMDWKPKDKLLDRPVNQGDPLLEVADPDGPWLLEVQLPERIVTHVAAARQQTKDGRLPVTYVLSSSPDATYEGWLVEIGTQSKAVDQENFVEAKIEIEKEDQDRFRKSVSISGIEVRVKIDCGPRPVGYVLFREVIDFVREYVFF